MSLPMALFAVAMLWTASMLWLSYPTTIVDSIVIVACGVAMWSMFCWMINKFRGW